MGVSLESSCAQADAVCDQRTHPTAAPNDIAADGLRAFQVGRSDRVAGEPSRRFADHRPAGRDATPPLGNGKITFARPYAQSAVFLWIRPVGTARPDPRRPGGCYSIAFPDAPADDHD
jgi:hypothetical protein